MQATINKVKNSNNGQTAIDKITEHLEQIRHGMSIRFTEACAPPDSLRQGDLYLTIVDKVPEGYVLKKKPGVQLVPGTNVGSKHCLDSLQGVKVYLPQQWGPESLDGPCLVLTEEREVLHPIHGKVTIPAGFTILCTYQREWEKEQAKARRAAD